MTQNLGTRSERLGRSPNSHKVAIGHRLKYMSHPCATPRSKMPLDRNSRNIDRPALVNNYLRLVDRPAKYLRSLLRDD